LFFVDIVDIRSAFEHESVSLPILLIVLLFICGKASSLLKCFDDGMAFDLLRRTGLGLFKYFGQSLTAMVNE